MFVVCCFVCTELLRFVLVRVVCTLLAGCLRLFWAGYWWWCWVLGVACWLFVVFVGLCLLLLLLLYVLGVVFAVMTAVCV